MIFNPDILAGRVALITGGGTGIGLGIATEMAPTGISERSSIVNLPETSVASLGTLTPYLTGLCP